MATALVLSALLSACALSQQSVVRLETAPRLVATTKLVSAKTGKPQKMQIGHASWYGPGFHGKKTASGVIFDQTEFTAAHRNLPLGSTVRVTNLDNQRSVNVEINDRGPFVDGRIIDLSRAAAGALGMLDDGLALVRIEVLSLPG
jgi:rare lipoprotein A